jgi:hypothetical protein
MISSYQFSTASSALPPAAFSLPASEASQAASLVALAEAAWAWPLEAECAAVVEA